MIKIKEIFVTRYQNIQVELQSSVIEGKKHMFLIKKRIIYFFSIPIFSSEEIVKHNI
jgi:hypothetical protein